MASFDPEESTQKPADVMGVKYPMKRLELSVHNFIKVLDIDLDRLHRHSENIKKLTNAEDWPGLHKEQVNASRTVQQIKANIREVERARTQVVDRDLGLFDSKVHDVKMKAISAVDGFAMLIGPGVSTTASLGSARQRTAVETGHGCDGTDSPLLPPSQPQLQETVSGTKGKSQSHRATLIQAFNSMDDVDSVERSSDSPAYGNLSVSMTTYAPAPVTTDLHVAPQHTDASNSWEQLQENIVELNDLVHHFADEVEQQGETLNTIEENIDSAEINVKEGTTSLAQASKFKSAMLPVVGAVVGGMVGGPIGFVAGMKLGGLAGVVGGAAGFAGGRMLKKHQAKIDQVELENLSDRRSISITETNDSTFAEIEYRGTTHCDSESSAFKQLSSNQEDSNQADGAEQAQGGIASITDIYSGVASSFKSLFTPQPDAQKEKS